MINTESNANGLGIGGTASPALDKLPVVAVKKTALRDVQNENVGQVQKQQKNMLTGGGRSTADAIKVCGTKRLTPERPLNSQSVPSFMHAGANENVMNARRRFDLELGKGRHSNVENFADSSLSKKIGLSWQDIPHVTNQMRDSNVHQNPTVTSKNMTPIMAFAGSSPSFPSSCGKQNISAGAAKVTPEIPRTVHSNNTNDQLRAERHSRLQKFLTQCDETYQRDFCQTFLHLPPAELSKHAWELEKRAIQLTLEEGQEMQRKTALNILGKQSSPLNNSLQPNKS